MLWPWPNGLMPLETNAVLDDALVVYDIIGLSVGVVGKMAGGDVLDGLTEESLNGNILANLVSTGIGGRVLVGEWRGGICWPTLLL